MKVYIDVEDIRALQREAEVAGDYEMASICARARDGDDTAWLECGRIILETRRNAEGRP